MSKVNVPAMPVVGKYGVHADGLTKREYFAGLAMSSFCGHPEFTTSSPEAIAAIAVEQADALLAELEATK